MACYVQLGLEPGCTLKEAKTKLKTAKQSSSLDKSCRAQLKKAFDEVRHDIQKREKASDGWEKALSTDFENLSTNKSMKELKESRQRQTSVRRVPDLIHPNNVKAFVYVLHKEGKGKELTSRQIFSKLEQERLLILYNDKSPRVRHLSFDCVMKMGPDSRLVGRIGSRLKDYGECIIGERRVARRGKYWRLSDEYWEFVRESRLF